jgi:predicted  nucleic acid-binding Zn-ribbon protein
LEDIQKKDLKLEKKKSKIIKLFFFHFQNKEINDLKSDITIFKNEQNNLNNEILELKNRMNDLENILNKKNFEEKIIQNINSNIFNSLDDIDFILNKLRNKDN